MISHNELRNIVIREEKNEDMTDVYNLIKESFSTAEHRDGTEHELVKKLHNGISFIRELSLVAEINDKVVGYALFTKAKIGFNDNALVLAPLAVFPCFQLHGIGSSLICEGHSIAKKLGYDCILVLGNNKYYSRFGYIPAYKMNIYTPNEFPKENFMALRLNTGEFIGGKVTFAEEFGL